MLYFAFVLGFLGSFHCVGMCSPITLIIPFAKHNFWLKNLQIFFYFLGKTITYVLLGLLFSIVGEVFFIREYQQFFSIFVGVALFFSGFVSLFKIGVNTTFSKWIFFSVGNVKKLLAQQLKKKSVFSIFLMGFFNGFLPCGLVYTALFGALTTGEITQVLLYMLVFGFGTIPLMLLFIYIGNFLTLNIKNKIQKAIPFFIILMGIFLIFRGLGIGVFSSPSENQLMIKNNADCIVPMKK